MKTTAPFGWPPTRVLVVDDEPFILELVEVFLREGGYAVGLAHSGAEALRSFSDDPYDLVITDRAMPGMDGDDLAEHIKGRAPGTPLIMITGFAKPGTRMEFFDDLLLKPFSRAQLLISVERALAGAALRASAA